MQGARLLKLLSLLSLSWLYFHSVLFQCIMNVFLERFYPYAHAHEGTDAAASDFPTFTFSSGFLCGRGCKSFKWNARSLEKSHTTEHSSQGIKKEFIYVTKYQQSLSSCSTFTTSAGIKTGEHKGKICETMVSQ